MSNTFIPQAVEIVKKAIDADTAGEYEKALPLYRSALEFFMTGLKYENNPAGTEYCECRTRANKRRLLRTENGLTEMDCRKFRFCNSLTIVLRYFTK